MAVDNVGLDVPMEFGDSRSNGFRGIRGTDLVSNEQMNERTLAKPIPIARNAFKCAQLSDWRTHLLSQKLAYRQWIDASPDLIIDQCTPVMHAE